MKSRHTPRKRFGQNFLHDGNVLDRIVRAIAPRAGEAILEIGPGQGALTRRLLEHDIDLTVIEIDRDLVAELEQDPELERARIISADALKVDLSELADERPLRVVGNLPYNVSTPLLFHVLRHAERVRDMHFMLQKEVVDRMAAEPGSRAYGRLSVMLQYRCRVEPLFTVSPGAFFPPPKVLSAIVRLQPFETPQPAARDEALLGSVVTAAFGKRRKTLANALKSLADPTQLERAGIDPGLRAERITVAEYVAIANVLAEDGSP